MPNQPKPGQVKVGFRMPEELLRRAEYMAAKIREENPGLEATAADAMRIILTKHLPPAPDGWAPPVATIAKPQKRPRKGKS